MYANGSSIFQRIKRKKIMKREMYGRNKDRNIEKNVFVIFDIIFKKIKKKENPWLLTSNGFTIC